NSVSRPPGAWPPTISVPPHPSTPVDEGRGEPGAAGTPGAPGTNVTRAERADRRGGQAGAVPAAELHSAARARSARRRGRAPRRLLPAGRSEPPADADRPRHRLAVSRGPQSHHRSVPQEEA